MQALVKTGAQAEDLELKDWPEPHPAADEVKLKISQSDNRRIEPNTVTVMVSEEISQKTVGVYLLDAITGAELATPLTVDVAISM